MAGSGLRDGEQLRAWMDAAGITSFRALAQRSGVSRRQVERLRRGEIEALSIQTAQKLAAALKISLMELLQTLEFNGSAALSPQPKGEGDSRAEKAVLAEYQRLKLELENVRAQVLATFQSEALNILEPLILQWPTAAYAAQQNPTAPALRLIPLLKPLEQLLQAWDLEVIGTVGEVVLYNPQMHQWTGHDSPAPNHPVQVSHVGYHQNQRLLYRAKVRLPQPPMVE